MTPPDIKNSTREEREHFVVEAFRCISDEELYADYIEGRRDFREITIEIRNSNY